jgi:hypothetical protein
LENIAFQFHRRINDKVDFNTWAMDAKVPVVLSDKLTLLPGFELTNNRISNSTDNLDF